MNQADHAPYRKFATLLDLNRKENHLLITCFLSAIFLVLLGVLGNAGPHDPSYDLAALSLWVTAAPLAMPFILPKLDDRWAKKKAAARSERQRAEEAEYRKKRQKRRRIPRTAQLQHLRDALEGDKRFIFLYGESGCGKTTLLSELREQLKKDKIKYVHKRDKYHESWADALTGDDKAVLILDQFELALQNKKELAAFFSRCKAGGRAKLVAAFPDEAFGALVSVLCACGISMHAVRPIPLTYTRDDQEDLRKKTLNCFQWNESTPLAEILDAREASETAALLAGVMDRIYRERILLIEWSLLMDAICRFSPDRISDIYRETPDFHQFMSRLLLLTLKQFSNPEIALPILYLLSRNVDEAYSITLYDLQLATFRREETVRQTLRELMDAGWVTTVLGSPEAQDSGTEYEISHEYIGKKFASICNAQLDAEILKNLNNYDFPACHGRREASRNSGKRKLYQGYQAGRSSPRLGVILRILLAAIVISAAAWQSPALIRPVWTPHPDLFPPPPSLCHAGLLAVCGLSTFYVYNFSYFVFCPYRRRAALVEVFGSAMVTLCLLVPPLWPMFLASEIIMVGAVLISCFPRGRKSGGNFFQTPGAYFILFGLCIFLFGAAFLRWNSTCSAVAFSSFALFIVSAIKLHINYDFVYHLLGKF